MKAAIFKEAGVMAVEERPMPTIQKPTDAIVRVVRACVCGSDLWWYRDGGKEPGQVGHEGIGVIETVGDAVSDFAPGDFVIIPFRLGTARVLTARKAIVPTACSMADMVRARPNTRAWNSRTARYIRYLMVSIAKIS